VEFDTSIKKDQLVVDNNLIEPASVFSSRVFHHVDLMRKMAGTNQKVIVHTHNTFPTGVGIASSASGFAALTLATSSALGLNMCERDLSEMARLGSGSACRSIPDGFCEWIASDANNKSYAIQIAPPEHWDISIVTVVVSKQAKQFSSTSGHTLAVASPFFKTRLESLPQRLDKIRSAILNRDFETFGRETELEAISFHSIAMTSSIQMDHGWRSGTYYWLPDSLELILTVQEWRMNGLDVYFTLDAGPSVHLLCLNKDLDQVINSIHEIEWKSRKNGIWDIMVNRPAQGAHIISDQLDNLD